MGMFRRGATRLPVPACLAWRDGDADAMSVRARGASHYEIVLLLVIVIIALTPFDSAAVRPLIVALLGTVIVFSFWTSGASRRALIAASALAIVALTFASAGQFAGGAFPRGVFAATGVTLCGGAIATIFGHLAAQTRVTRRTVTGALSVYLLIGLLFAYLFAFIAVVGSHGFFAERGPHGATDYIYFSYVSLTTVGYGDLTAASSFGRVMAILEALMGQLYLVTIVAVVVGNIGRKRSAQRRRAPGGYGMSDGSCPSRRKRRST
jgi:hypothetical protein